MTLLQRSADAEEDNNEVGEVSRRFTPLLIDEVRKKCLLSDDFHYESSTTLIYGI